jgi:hypothetical protein
VRHVDHLAVRDHRADAEVVFENRDHAQRVFALFVRWRERTNGDLADKTRLAITQAIGLESTRIAKVGGFCQGNPPSNTIMR